MTDDVKTEGAAPSAAQENANPYASGKLTPEIERQFRASAMGKEQDQPAKENTAPPDAQEKTAESEGKPENAPAPDAGKEAQQETSSRRKPQAEQRISELIADGKTKDAEIERLRAELASKTTKPAEASTAKPAEQQPPRQTAAQQLEALKEPDIKDPKYQGDDGWTLYEADVRKYNREFASLSAAKAVEEDRQQRATEQRNTQLQNELTQAREVYKDFDTVGTPVMKTFMEDQGIHPAVKEALGRSPVFTHLLYAIGQDKALVERFIADAKENPIEAIMHLGALQASVMDELSKKSTKDGKTESPAKTKTSEPPQETREVGNRGTGPTDASADAARRGSFRDFDAAQRARMAREHNG